MLLGGINTAWCTLSFGSGSVCAAVLHLVASAHVVPWAMTQRWLPWGESVSGRKALRGLPLWGLEACVCCLPALLPFSQQVPHLPSCWHLLLTSCPIFKGFSLSLHWQAGLWKASIFSHSSGRCGARGSLPKAGVLPGQVKQAFIIAKPSSHLHFKEPFRYLENTLKAGDSLVQILTCVGQSVHECV